jgi:hypothetical protein
VKTFKNYFMENNNHQECIFCKKDDSQVPLVQLSYQKVNYWICPQHIPILIHEPGKLAGMLPDAENLHAG